MTTNSSPSPAKKPARKNPNKLQAAEKRRFLSVLGKDPSLQADVADALRDEDYIVLAPKQMLDNVLRKVREQTEELVAAATAKADEIQAREDVQAAKARVTASAAAVREKVKR